MSARSRASGAGSEVAEQVGDVVAEESGGEAEAEVFEVPVLAELVVLLVVVTAPIVGSVGGW